MHGIKSAPMVFAAVQRLAKRANRSATVMGQADGVNRMDAGVYPSHADAGRSAKVVHVAERVVNV